jgi:GNAT superfamily N-acetyltransferase
MPLTYRFALPCDAPVLAQLNLELIRDEGHRNPMNLAQLTERMAAWLEAEYQAVLFEDATAEPPDVVGYALFRREPDFVYLRQLFVARARRRQGIGRAALDWLWQHAWADAERLRIDVLVGNAGARAFWKSVGFADYCFTMEAVRPA